jgi:hypothetical protein
MALDATARRRWFGGIVLTAALLMLVCGQTILQGQLTRLPFLIYWLVCFLLTGLAAITALRDLREVSRRTRQQHKDLLETTLKEIEREAHSKKSTRSE